MMIWMLSSIAKSYTIQRKQNAGCGLFARQGTLHDLPDL